jgi:hypothetical protein
MDAFPQKNYTLGRGQLFFQKFDENGVAVGGQRYIGNTPEINLTSESESLDHFDSDAGVKEKDKSVLLSLNRTGSFITDQISPANLALFFLGSETITNVAAVTDATHAIADVLTGQRYQIGANPSNPAGVRNVSGVTIVKGATPLVLGTDYTLDADSGGVTFLDSSATVNDGDDVVVTYDLAASAHNTVVTGASASINGSLFYKSNNPEGAQFDYFWPKVTLKPDGDFALKGDDWQQISFSFEILKKDDNTEAQYVNGRADVGVGA